MEHLLNLSLWGGISFGIACIVFIEVLGHFKFYRNVIKETPKTEMTHHHTKRINVLIAGVGFAILSVALYGVNWIAFNGGDTWRLLLKWFQIFSLLHLWYALRSLRKFYKDLR